MYQPRDTLRRGRAKNPSLYGSQRAMSGGRSSSKRSKLMAARARNGNYFSSSSLDRDSRAWDMLHKSTPATLKPSNKSFAHQEEDITRRHKQLSSQRNKMHDSPSSSLDEFRPRSSHQHSAVSRSPPYSIHQVQGDSTRGRNRSPVINGKQNRNLRGQLLIKRRNLKHTLRFHQNFIQVRKLRKGHEPSPGPGLDLAGLSLRF